MPAYEIRISYWSAACCSSDRDAKCGDTSRSSRRKAMVSVPDSILPDLRLGDQPVAKQGDLRTKDARLRVDDVIGEGRRQHGVEQADATTVRTEERRRGEGVGSTVRNEGVTEHKKKKNE